MVLPEGIIVCLCGMQRSHSLHAPWLLLQGLVHQLLVPLLWCQAAEVLSEVLTLRYPVHEGDPTLSCRRGAVLATKRLLGLRVGLLVGSV